MDAAARSSSTLRVALLGRLEVELNGVPLHLGGRHAQALMALLVLRPRPRLREAIAADLWPDFEGPSASALRQALWLVRHAFIRAGIAADAVLDVGPETLGIRPETRIELDTTRFEGLVEQAPDSLDEALRLYRGDLAEGLGHECFAADRERLSDLYEDALATAAQVRLDGGDVPGARAAAGLLLARDPLREEAHSVLIAAYGIVGSRSQVIRQYRRVCEILATELAVNPLPETDATYHWAVAATESRSAERARGFARQALPRVLAATG